MQTGSLQYSQVNLSILNVQAGSGPILSYLAFILLIAGFAVKTGAVPFHSWLRMRIKVQIQPYPCF